MILLVHDDKSQITDFIMWADVEFAMQLELLETRRFQSQHCTIIDMSELGQLGNVGASEPLFVICHGSSGSSDTYLDGQSWNWKALGKLIGEKLSGQAKTIVLFACYAADGHAPNRPIDLFARGLRKFRSGVSITGYQGATVTNTIGTVTAREQPGGSDHGAFLVVDDSKMRRAGGVDKYWRNHFGPQLQFNSYLSSHPGATARQKAIAAAEKAEQFYAAFSTSFMQEGLYYSVGANKGLPVVVTS